MAIPLNERLNAPLIDDIMTYNFIDSRYVITVQGVQDLAYIDLLSVFDSVDNAQAHLDLMSRVVYESIMRFKRPEEVLKSYYYISHSKIGRKALLDIFVDSNWFNETDGGFMVLYNTGINLNEMKEIPMDIKRSMSVIAEQIVKNSRLAERLVRYNLNDFYNYDTLDDLLEAMELEGYITVEKKDTIKCIEEIPSSPKYKVFKDFYGKYVLEERDSWLKKLEKKGVDW